MLFIREASLCADPRAPGRPAGASGPRVRLRTEAGALRGCARAPPWLEPGGRLQGNRRCSRPGRAGGAPAGSSSLRAGPAAAGGHLQPLPSPARGADPRDLSCTQQRAQLGAARPRPPPQGPARDRTRLLGRPRSGDTHTHPRKLYSIFPAKVIILRRTKRKNLCDEQRGERGRCGRGSRGPAPEALAAGGVRAAWTGLREPTSHLNFLDARQGLLPVQVRSSFTRAGVFSWLCVWLYRAFFFFLSQFVLLLFWGRFSAPAAHPEGVPSLDTPPRRSHQPIRLGLGGGPRGGVGAFTFSFLFVLGCPRPESWDPPRARGPGLCGRSSIKEKKTHKHLSM